MMTISGKIPINKRQNLFHIFFSLILIVPTLVGCGPSAEELAAVDYTPLSIEDWEVSTPAEQGLDPDLIAVIQD